MTCSSSRARSAPRKSSSTPSMRSTRRGARSVCIAILRSKLSGPAVGAVPSDVLDFIAQKVQSNIRELEGSLNRLLAHSRHLQQPVTVELASQVLHALVAPGPSGRGATPNAVLLAVARYYGVKADDLKARSRHKQIVEPRQ